MTRLTYPWKRFWYPRAAEFQLTDSGYLADPDSEYGRILNPDSVPFEDLADRPCLVLLGEPGIGKSRAIKAAPDAVNFDLGAFQTDSSLANAVFQNPRMAEWTREAGGLTLCLDSLDEGRLAISNIGKVLLRELEQFRHVIGRLRLRIACRTADWPPTLEDGLRDLWGEPNVHVYQLAPLRRQDIVTAAEAHGLDSSVFLGEIDRREAVPLAIKPITLEFLLACFKKGQQFPARRTVLYHEGCRALCEESDERRDAGSAGELSAHARLGIAARIAALTIVGGYLGVWNGSDRGDVPDGYLSVRRMCGGVERISDSDIDVDEAAIREALGTGLFTARGPNQLGWSHHTYAEFLAAHFIAEHHFSDAQVMSLLTVADDKEAKLAPQLHETAAWLASMRPEFFRRIMAVDPSVLLLSDVATAEDVDRENLVESLLKLYDDESLLDSNWGLRALYRKLPHPRLPQQLIPYMIDPTKGTVVRRVAIDIAEACELRSVQNELAEVALNRSEELATRVQAGYALARIADEQTRLRLKPLALEPRDEDIEDELKGCALRATWPNLLSTEELFASLSRPKVENFGGCYSHFITTGLLSDLQSQHLPSALNWLGCQRTRRELGIHLEKVSDCIMNLAWDHLHDDGVIEPFIAVLVVRFRGHDAVFGDSRKTTRNHFGSDDGKRRLLLTHLLPQFGVDEMMLLTWLFPGLGKEDEFFWLLEQYKHCADEHLKPKWLVLMIRCFDSRSGPQLEAILAERVSDPSIAKAVSPFVDPIELNSPHAEQCRQAYQRDQEIEEQLRAAERRPVLSPPPAERVSILLRRIEEGEIGLWWRLQQELTLETSSTRYDLMESDITAMPGWRDADQGVHKRLIVAAHKYLLNGDPQNGEWIGKEVWFWPAVAGARTFLLLVRERRELIESLNPDIWAKWVASLLGCPGAGQDHHDQLLQQLIQMAHRRAPDEMVRAVSEIIDGENQLYDHPGVIQRLHGCWDEKLAGMLYSKCEKRGLKPGFSAVLLEKMLSHNHAPAVALALSLISVPLPKEGSGRDLAVGAASALFRFSPGANWQALHRAFRGDVEFSRSVFDLLTHQIDSQGNVIASQLDDGQLSELFLWLLDAYPESELEGWMKPKDFAAGWRNGILQVLQSRGTDSACEAIIHIMRERPELTYLKWSLQSALEATRLRKWKPVEPNHILQMAKDSTKRIVRGGEELLDAIIESLRRLQTKLRGETPLASNLWNQAPDGTWEPKDEDHFSDNVKQHLEDDLRGRGIVLNREVVIRRNRGESKGERTDIHVDAVAPGAAPTEMDLIKAIIEVKGCWNKDLWTAMEEQLTNRYLHENQAKHGLYLVAWYNCTQWSPNDSRRPPDATVDDAQSRLEKQANLLSGATLLVRALVIDTSLR